MKIDISIETHFIDFMNCRFTIMMQKGKEWVISQVNVTTMFQLSCMDLKSGVRWRGR